MRRILCGALLAACALFLALPGAASARIFLQLEGIPGESTAVGFENQIELQDFGFDVGKSKDKPASFSEFDVAKRLDKASPELMLRTANGATIPTAQIRLTRQTGDANAVFLRYCFTGVRITSFSQRGNEDSSVNESISFSYATIVQSYTQQDPAGGQGTVFSKGWDLLRNLQFQGACD
jgi:type VI secretion system Hcp family effector